MEDLNFVRSGGNLSNPHCPQMDQTTINKRQVDYYEYNTEWEKAYWCKAFEAKGQGIPLPHMYKGTPCFSGCLLSDKAVDRKIPEGHVYVGNIKGQYLLVDGDKLKTPTDFEYNMYFKHLYDSNAVTLVKHTENYNKLKIKLEKVTNFGKKASQTSV